MYVDTTFTRRYGKVPTGETLVCVAEPGNSHDRNAVAVEKYGKVIGRLPQSVAVVSFF